MSEIVIYGSRGKVIAKPFQINSADDEPEVITSEEKQIINYLASDTEQTDENQGSAPDE